MREIFKKIIEKELCFTQLASKQFSEKDGVTRENVKEVLGARSIEIRAVISETNALIDEYITPLIKNIESISMEQALELQEFAEQLSGYKENIDTGLCYDIRDALAKYARNNNNDEMYIKNMFFKGIALFYLESNLFKKEMSECYDNVIAYSDRYEQFDSSTRNIIARAYGNSYISVADLDINEIYRRYDRALDFWDNKASKIDPQANWKAFHQNLNENLCSTTITALRSDRMIYVSHDKLKRLLKSAELLYDARSVDEHQHSHDYTTAQVKYYYYYSAANYYNGTTGSKELLKMLYDIYKQAEDEYTYDDLFKKLHVAGLYLFYLHHTNDKELSKADKLKITNEIEKDVFNYVMNIPDSMSRQYVTTMLTNFAIGSHKIFDDTAYLKLLLSLTVFRHAPTYVHSVMVSKISYIITEYILRFYPEKFVGLPGYTTVEDVKNKSAEILLFVWYAGLIHDIGKIVYSHMVSFYVRKLNDKEFEMIKQHAAKATAFIKSAPNLDLDSIIFETLEEATTIMFDSNPQLFSCFSDIALGHHKSFDGSFGYPKEFDNLASPVKAIIDIVTIADSIDAATDNVGRSYANEKTLYDMEQDLMSQIGDRYCPFITSMIFEKKPLFNAVNNALSKFRYDIYYSCFSISDFSKTMMPPKADQFNDF